MSKAEPRLSFGRIFAAGAADQSHLAAPIPAAAPRLGGRAANWPHPAAPGFAYPRGRAAAGQLRSAAAAKTRLSRGFY